MKIIAEKINGTRKRVAQAIQERDAEFIQNLAKEQAEAGATWLDANAGTAPQREPEDLIWLVENIQAVTDTPIALDSANPRALEAAIKVVKNKPMINSISLEPGRMDVFPIVAEHKCPAVALAMDEKGIPKTKDERINTIGRILEKTRSMGIQDDSLYFDPLAMTIGTGQENALLFFDTVRQIRAKFPEVHITCGLSNISFGLPARKYINRVFLALCMESGMDCAICNPNSKDIQTTILAAELLLNKDRYCLKYTRAFRAGVFDE
ncbi:MAG: methyltetrahydrofolate cobalamin methyltransferase [Acidobacteria bacterium]|nr:methyltetrahydrofolate cobalamin methyltransferase [Acidobacteriota bacterium]